jgi:hypothetical protein
MKKAVYVLLMMVFLWVLSFLIYSVLSIVNNSPEQVYISIIGLLCALWGYGLGEYWWDYIYGGRKNAPKWISFFCRKK